MSVINMSLISGGGMKFASGIATASNYYISVSGLNFRPKMVIASYQNKTNPNVAAVFDSQTSEFVHGFWARQTNLYNLNSSQATSSEGGFSCYINYPDPLPNMYWYAYGE